MIRKVMGIALRPRQEWPVIAEEKTSVGALMTGLIIPLTAIGPICEFLRIRLFGGGWGIDFSTSLLAPLGVFEYVLRILGVLLAAYLVHKLAPTYQSSGDFVQALKLVSYAQAPYWLAQVVDLIPFLQIIALLVGLYGLYLAYVGLPVVMKTPQEKALPYLGVVIVVLFVIWIAIIGVTSLIVGIGFVSGCTS